MKAMWKGEILADSNNTVVVEGNHYFPKDSVNCSFFRESSKTSVCPWKGTASYYSVTVDGEENTDAAWAYPTPKDKAVEIKDHLAFWKGVTVTP